MNLKIKEYEHYCKFCGKLLVRKRFSNGRLEDFNVFQKRKYCNRECMKNSFLKIGDNHDQTYRNAHVTSKKINENILKKDKCEICGSKKNLDIHHKDNNWKNNNLNNLQCLCRSCHTKKHKPKGKCIICGEFQEALGYCNKHYIRFKKYGDPLFTKNKKTKGDVINGNNI